MEDFVNSSPINLNPQNNSTSPFLNSLSGGFDGVGPNFGENIFSKKAEEEAAETAPKENIEEHRKSAKRRRINDFDADILSKYSGENTKKLSFTGKLYNFFKKKQGELKIESWKDLKTLGIDDFEDFKEFVCSLFLPGLYKSKTMKTSLKKLVALNRMADDLITKKIPYGEATDHYNTLIENLSLATNIQADLKKRIS